MRNGTLNATFDTFSSNIVTNGDQSAGTGSDIYVLSDKSDGGNNTSPGSGTATATIVNSILGQNAATTVSDFYANTNAGGTVPNLGNSENNLLRMNATGPNRLTGAIFTGSPNFAPGLSNHGGPTQTIALTSNSTLALGQASTGTGITVDQCGVERSATTPDLGAFESTTAISWNNPSAIVFGTALSSTQLDATASVAGTFTYSPAAGTVLAVGNNQTLSVTFTPNDRTIYTTAKASVSINVTQATPTITWSNPSAIVVGTALSSTQLDATASVAGTFIYSPAAGTVLHAGNNQTLSVTFTPTDTTDFTTAKGSVLINVTQATPTISWNNPSAIVFGTALSGTQLDASASVPGTFTYSPAAGTVLAAGNNQTLSVTFTPTDTADFTTTSANTTIDVQKASPTVSVDLVNIAFGTALDNSQLEGSATGTVGGSQVAVAGSFSYSTAAGQVLNVGNAQTEQVTFTPDDTANYNVTSTNVTINVAPVPAGTITTDQPTFSWAQVSGATHYKLIITDTKTRLIVVDATKLATTSDTLTAAQALTPGRSYRWTAEGVRASGKITVAARNVSFTVAALGEATPVAPAGTISTDTPTFSWNPSTDVADTASASFSLTITDTKTHHVVKISHLDGTSFTLTAKQALKPGHSFTWFVTAISTNGKASVKSALEEFTID
jgi:hypothetical protein